MLLQLGQYSLKVNQYCKIVKYWICLTNKVDNSLLRSFHSYQYQLADNRIHCWTLKVKTLLFRYGFGSV